MPAYYSEFDPKAAAWLRELIKRGLIADGVVDERDLWDVAPADLVGFTQVHLCAGIGVWSYSLRSAGWSDDRPVWTGSFPCQPFSAAGKGEGFADERHLWPAGCHLIAECRPSVVFGEQVASKDAEPWLDLVQDDLEALDYAVGAVPFPSAGVGAPHIRDRLYWVADSQGAGGRQQPRAVFGAPGGSEGEVARQGYGDAARTNGTTGLVADAGSVRLPFGSIADDGRGTVRLEGTATASRLVSGGLGNAERISAGRHSGASVETQGRAGLRSVSDDTGSSGAVRGLADAAGARHPEAREHERGPPQFPPRSAEHGGVVRPTGPANGLWRDADWLFCRDGKWRPVEPGTFPLAHGAPGRVGRLRGYGNTINAEAAKVFIEAYLDTRTIEAGA